MDDTETETATAQIRRLSSQFDLAERAARYGYWRHELNTATDYWSPGMYRLMGLDPSHKPDGTWLMRQLPEGELEKIQEVLRDALRKGAPFHYRVRDVTLGPEAQYTPGQVIDTQGEVEMGDNGRAIALLGVCQNVTEKVHAEEQKEKAQEQYRLMTREASDIILLFGSHYEIVFASDALQRLLKRDVAEIEFRNFLKLVHPGDLAEARKTLVLPGPGESQTSTYRIKHGDGHYVWVETVTRSIYDEAGRFRNLVSVSRDVTARKKQETEMMAAQARAEAASQAKSRFLGNMSHELRTPLNAIIGFADLMRQKMLGPLGHPRYDEYVTIIYDSGQHLLDLVTDILDMAKIEAGKRDLNFEHMDLAGIIKDCVRLLRGRADANELGLVMPATSPIFLLADKRAVKQVIINLLSNAIKFTPPGGAVSIWAEEERDHARLIVRDTGIGISPEDLKRLGNPFEQAASETFVAQGGTGLGLAMAKALAEQHGGGLTIESVEGRGTQVSVEFPIADKARATA